MDEIHRPEVNLLALFYSLLAGVVVTSVIVSSLTKISIAEQESEVRMEELRIKEKMIDDGRFCVNCSMIKIDSDRGKENGNAES